MVAYFHQLKEKRVYKSRLLNDNICYLTINI